VITRNPPSRLLRLFFKAPIVLYRLRMGWLLRSRFLLLTHTGRRTGQTRLTVLEVVSYDRSIPEVVVIAAWGERAQWVRNLGRLGPVAASRDRMTRRSTRIDEDAVQVEKDGGVRGDSHQLGCSTRLLTRRASPHTT
jgi:deazaflavin-dependent oxidoreductase (nitroreductase family)